ncbi:lipopolysaccharide biosynthesis protein [Parabacteroides sp. AF18-52]|uniref:lipopolysaccharide biosynthesis protein n=1 Tax=Parabacteroides sp. AF18-52 TaxID=2292242 RepID=UPI000F00ACC1|nr:lipopolysaccharide biosynthesis protein [Parabacteroides sp. AF18-52]RHR43030.1 lipopolysaccharide biosynthesis protein [Parabacteroides sp. AF18-52]
MSDISLNNKRIAKNTLLLYVRMLVMLFISLFTSRIVLQSLGVDNYGIYNVVGGLVSMFSILSSALNAAIVRFISIELGKKDSNKLNLVFCTSVSTQILLIVIVVVLLETVGLWFLNYKLVIPVDRIVAANWVFQFSVLTFVLNMWSIPYNAEIIAHEKMNVFAYVSILESVAKLMVAVVILFYSKDKLIFYALLLCIVSIGVRLTYGIYCSRMFEECRFRFFTDRGLLKEMFGFAGWNFIGASSTIIREQGCNMLLNMFFGPAVNTAKGLAFTVNSAVMGFVGNFMIAINPQIYKSYSIGEHKYTMQLVFQSTRLSYYIILLLGLPIIVTAPYLLQLWLGVVPEHTVAFVRLVIIFSMSESLAGSLLTLTYAIGRIQTYQIVIGLLQILNIPIVYLMLDSSYPPESVYIVAITISIVSEIARLIILRKEANLNVIFFLKEVYFNVFIVTIFASVGILLLTKQFECNSFVNFSYMIVVCLIVSILSIYIFGLTMYDRRLVIGHLKNFFRRLFR